MTFKQWMKEVDILLTDSLGIDSMCLEDWLWADAFESGASPGEAAMEALEHDTIYCQAVEEGLVDL